MKNTPVEIDGKQCWVSRSMAVVAYVYAYIGGELCILANKRGPGLPNNVGKWNAPSGYLDYDETLEECAAREVWEETGLKINPSDLRLEELDSTPTRRGQNVIVRYSMLRYNTDGTIVSCLTDEHSEPNEVDEIKWVPLKHIHEYEWTSEKHKKCILDYADQYKV